jgi:hypothetical protein
MFNQMDYAAQSLIDEAIGISVAMDGSISYESVFNSTHFERTRMVAFLERRHERMQAKAKR